MSAITLEVGSNEAVYVPLVFVTDILSTLGPKTRNWLDNCSVSVIRLRSLKRQRTVAVSPFFNYFARSFLNNLHVNTSIREKNILILRCICSISLFSKLLFTNYFYTFLDYKKSLSLQSLAPTGQHKSQSITWTKRQHWQLIQQGENLSSSFVFLF